MSGSDRDLHVPDGRRPSALAMVLHPHPAMGGDRHHPLMVAMADRLAEEGLASLRLDLPDPDLATASKELGLAAEEACRELGVGSVLLVGYSWGSIVTSLAQPEGLAARVLVAPPVGSMEIARLDDLPLLALVPAHDQFGPPDAVRAALADDERAVVEIIDGCDHFLAGAVDRIARRVAEWVVPLV